MLIRFYCRRSDDVRRCLAKNDKVNSLRNRFLIHLFLYNCLVPSAILRDRNEIMQGITLRLFIAAIEPIDSFLAFAMITLFV